jgi:hypothetical protein
MMILGGWVLSNSDNILEFLEANYPNQYCDDCISTELGIRPRQQVNQICRRLEKDGKIKRLRLKCENCHKIKITNKIEPRFEGLRQKENMVKGQKIKLTENELKSIAKINIEELRNKIVRICQELWSETMRVKPPRSISKVINILKENKHIPSHLANMMLTICNLRNSYVYDGLELGEREKIIAYYAWEIISDWKKVSSE